MATRENSIDRADRDAHRMLATIGREIREARSAGGLSQEVVGERVGISHAQVSRIERGVNGSASVRVLARLSQAVGLDLSVRAFPGGDPIRDGGQLRLLERLRRQVHRALGWRTEVPLPIAGDRRACDAVITGPGWVVAVEAETRLTDVQALARRLELKRRDGGVEHVILLVADTRTNRSVLAVARPMLEAAFPLAQGAILGALARGTDPGGSGIVIL
jgi:transcriptional regulator with XRE-family HTH domain